jgi:protein TonB
MNIEGFSHLMIRSAARRAPAGLGERLEEEWRADLLAQHGDLARLRFALGCCWATQVIAREFPARAVVLSPATGQSIGFAPYDASLFSRRTGAIVLILALHILALYGFASGLGHQLITYMPGPIQGVLLPQQPTPPQSLPRPEVTFHPQRIDMPVVAPDFVFPDDAAPNPAGIAPTVSPPTSVPAPEHKVTRVAGGPGAGFPATDDFYPAASRRSGESGIATVRVCVDGRGRLTQGPEILESAGSALLDQSALKLARAGTGHYRPTVEDGRAINDCYAYRIRFELRD